VHFALQSFLGGIGLLWSDHLNEAKTARLLCVRITHDVALLDFTILLEEASDFFLAEAGMNPSHEQVGARVACTVIFIHARL
jgi:hypothetical protein